MAMRIESERLKLGEPPPPLAGKAEEARWNPSKLIAFTCNVGSLALKTVKPRMVATVATSTTTAIVAHRHCVPSLFSSSVILSNSFIVFLLSCIPGTCLPAAVVDTEKKTCSHFYQHTPEIQRLVKKIKQTDANSRSVAKQRKEDLKTQKKRAQESSKTILASKDSQIADS